MLYNISMKLPSAVTVEYLRGNVTLPQIRAGGDLYIGRALLASYLAPEADGIALWDSVRTGSFTISDEAANKTTDTMVAMHKHYGLEGRAPLNLSDEQRPIFTRIATELIRSAAAFSTRTVTNSAARLMPAEFKDTSKPKSKTAGELLFSRTESGELKRPEGQALLGLHQAMVDTFNHGPGKAASNAYKKAIPEFEDHTASDYIAFRSESRYQFIELATAASMASLPQIEQDTGVRIEPAIVNNLVGELFAT